MKFIKKFFPIIAVLILSFWAIKPLLAPGFFPIHDNTQIARVFEMTKSLKTGMFPVRWVEDLGFGYGYPIFNFYAPLAYYAGSIFNLAGLDALFATKLMMGLGIILAGIFMYLFAKEMFGEAGGIVASLFYVYAPYHAVDIYVRGDVAEFWAYAFIPLAFYGIWKTYKENKFSNLIIGALGYAGIILSHNLTAMMVSPFLLVFVLILIILSDREKRAKTLLYLLSVLIGGLILSCFYWLPALFEMRYTNVLSQVGTGGFKYWQNFICVSQLWTSQWGFGGSGPGCSDGFSLMIGKLHVLLSAFSMAAVLILLFAKKYKADKEKLLVTLLLFIGFVFSAFMTLGISLPIWQAIPLMSFFQFPWRFLVMTSFFASALAGSFLWLLTYVPLKRIFPHYIWEAAGILVIVLLFISVKYFAIQTIVNKPPSYFTGKLMLEWDISNTTHEYMPKNFYIPKNVKEIPSGEIKIISGNVEVKNADKKVQSYTFKTDALSPSSVVVPIAYFPVWKVFIDKNPVSFSVRNDGIAINLSTGTHTVMLQYSQTSAEELSDLISLTGIAILVAGIIFLAKKRYDI